MLILFNYKRLLKARDIMRFARRSVLAVFVRHDVYNSTTFNLIGASSLRTLNFLEKLHAAQSRICQFGVIHIVSA